MESSSPFSTSLSLFLAPALLRTFRTGCSESSSQWIRLFRLRGCFPVLSGLSVGCVSEAFRLDRYQSSNVDVAMVTLRNTELGYKIKSNAFLDVYQKKLATVQTSTGDAPHA